MRWWDRDGVSFSELEKGLALINQAPSKAQQRYQSFVSALALFAKGYCWLQRPELDGEGQRIRHFMKEGGRSELLDADLFASTAVRALMTLSPRIADESVIDEVRRTRRSLELTNDEWNSARRAHNELVTALVV